MAIPTWVPRLRRESPESGAETGVAARVNTVGDCRLVAICEVDALAVVATWRVVAGDVTVLGDVCVVDDGGSEDVELDTCYSSVRCPFRETQMKPQLTIPSSERSLKLNTAVVSVESPSVITKLPRCPSKDSSGTQLNVVPLSFADAPVNHLPAQH